MAFENQQSSVGDVDAAEKLTSNVNIALFLGLDNKDPTDCDGAIDLAFEFQTQTTNAILQFAKPTHHRNPT